MNSKKPSTSFKAHKKDATVLEEVDLLEPLFLSLRKPPYDKEYWWQGPADG
jgi:hypothetical protein